MFCRGNTLRQMKQQPTLTEPSSAKPILLLTRPEAGAQRVLQACEEIIGYVPDALVSPVLEIIPVGDWPDLTPYKSVILTSAYACRGTLTGCGAYCVGERTAAAAREKGAEIAHVSPDAARLIEEVPAIHQRAIYLRGKSVSTDPAAQYGCDEKIVYDQQARPLTDAAQTALAGERPVILPLFSPRSARLVAEGVTMLGQNIHVLALSPAVAHAWEAALPAGACPVPVEICATPTQVEMVGRIVASLGPQQVDKDKG